MIQTRNGRTLSYHPAAGFEGAPQWIMTGPTGTRSINVKKTCIVRLAAHWGSFCDAKRGPKFTAQLLEAVVKAFLVREDCEVEVYVNKWTGEVEAEKTHFRFGTLGDCDITKRIDGCGSVEGYVYGMEWHVTDTSDGGISDGEFYPVELASDYSANAARAKAMSGLVQHIVDVIAEDNITLPQIVA